VTQISSTHKYPSFVIASGLYLSKSIVRCVNFISISKKNIFQDAFCSTRVNNLNGEESPNRRLFNYERSPESNLSTNCCPNRVLLSTCSNIIKEAKRRAAEQGGNPNLCAPVNLAPKPNSQKGCNAALTAEQKRHLVEVALSDSKHCRMTYGQLALAGRGKLLIVYLRFYSS